MNKKWCGRMHVMPGMRVLRVMSLVHALHVMPVIVTACLMLVMMIPLYQGAGGGSVVHAAEENDALNGELMQITEDAVMYDTPDAGGVIVTELHAGDFVFVTEETDDWYVIFYQGETGYVSKETPAADNPYKEAVTKEMDEQEQTDSAYLESLTVQQTAQRRARAWRTIIFLLITALIIVALLAGVWGNQRKDERGG